MAARRWLQETGGEARWRCRFLLCGEGQRGGSTSPEMQWLTSELGRHIIVSQVDSLFPTGLRQSSAISSLYPPPLGRRDNLSLLLSTPHSIKSTAMSNTVGCKSAGVSQGSPKLQPQGLHTTLVCALLSHKSV